MGYTAEGRHLPTSYGAALALFTTARDPSYGKPISTNYRIQRSVMYSGDPTPLGIRYHWTEVGTFFPDGSVGIYLGGYTTTSTMAVVNRVLKAYSVSVGRAPDRGVPYSVELFVSANPDWKFPASFGLESRTQYQWVPSEGVLYESNYGAARRPVRPVVKVRQPTKPPKKRDVRVTPRPGDAFTDLRTGQRYIWAKDRYGPKLVALPYVAEWSEKASACVYVDPTLPLFSLTYDGSPIAVLQLSAVAEYMQPLSRLAEQSPP